MDPNISLIVSALTTAIARLSEPIVQDAYTALKTLIKQKFSESSKVQGAVDGIETEPTAWRLALENALNEVKANEHKDIVEAAHRLQKAVGSESSGNISHSGTGDILTGKSRKISTGRDYIEGNQTLHGSTDEE